MTEVSRDSGKMRLTAALMRRRQPRPLIPEPPPPPTHTDVSTFRRWRSFLPFSASNHDLGQLLDSRSRTDPRGLRGSGVWPSFRFMLGE